MFDWLDINNMQTNNRHLAYVGIGSNLQRKYHIQSAVKWLSEHFEKLEYSPIYESKSQGFKGNNFYNLVACFHTSLSPADLKQTFKQFEQAHGRLAEHQKFANRNIDIDLLLYDDLSSQQPVQLPRDEILKYAFVLKPLSDIAPDKRHPVSGKTFLEHWQQFDAENNFIQRIDLKL